MLHAVARLVRGGGRRRPKIQASWPWAHAITTAWRRINALPHVLEQREPSLRSRNEKPRARGIPATWPASRATVIPQRENRDRKPARRHSALASGFRLELAELTT